jgi:hypothetical protein
VCLPSPVQFNSTMRTVVNELRNIFLLEFQTGGRHFARINTYSDDKSPVSHRSPEMGRLGTCGASHPGMHPLS